MDEMGEPSRAVNHLKQRFRIDRLGEEEDSTSLLKTSGPFLIPSRCKEDDGDVQERWIGPQLASRVQGIFDFLVGRQEDQIEYMCIDRFLSHKHVPGKEAAIALPIQDGGDTGQEEWIGLDHQDHWHFGGLVFHDIPLQSFQLNRMREEKDLECHPCFDPHVGRIATERRGRVPRIHCIRIDNPNP